MGQAMFEQLRFRTEEADLNVAEGPAHGPPLLLLHGVLRCWQDFAPLLPALSARWQVHALDHRGHGRSGRTPGNYLVADYARDAVSYLGQFNQPAVLYGHSLGAMVAAAAAAAAPQAVKALVLEDPPFDTMGPRIARTSFHSLFVAYENLLGRSRSVPELARELAEVRVTTPGADKSVRLGDVRDAASLRFSASCLAKVDPQVLAPIVAGRWLEGYDRSRVLAGIRCPVLLLQADESAGGMLVDSDAAEAQQAIADCTLIRVPGVGHLIHWSAIETTLRLVLPFLESLA